MNTIQRIAKNTAALFAAQFVVALLSLALSIFIARSLGDVIFGKFSFAIAFTSIFAIFLSLGFPTVIMRDVARDKSLAPMYLGNIAVINAILSVIIFGLIVLTINLMCYPHDTTIAILIFGISNIFISFANIFRVIFRAFERMEYEALLSITRQILTFSLSLVALFLGYGLIAIACVFLISSIFDSLLSFFICIRKFATPKLEIDIKFWKKITKSALPIAFLGATALIYTRIDTVMLSAMEGDAVVGWYNVAYSLVLGLKPIPILLMTALFPVMATFYTASRNSLKTAYEKSLRYLFMLGLPMSTGIMLLSDRFILLLYGEQFGNSIIALQILAWDVLLFFLYANMSFVLVSMNKQNKMAAASGGCAAINVILNLILIPRFSYIGAGIATIATETVLLGLYFYFLSKYLCRLSLQKIIIRPLVACVTMAIFIYFCNGINLTLLILSAAVVYFAMLCITKSISSEDIGFIKKILKKSKDG